MGWYSNLDLEVQNRENKFSDRVDALVKQRDFLLDQLEELDRIRPHDPMDPLYDQYFYSDHTAELWELPMTVQGVLDTIRLIDEEIDKTETEEHEHLALLHAVLDTGATPAGQMVLSAKLFPIEDLWLDVA